VLTGAFHWGDRSVAQQGWDGRYPSKREVSDMNWRSEAACRTEDPELFFPVGTTGPALDQLAEAKAACYRCPVASQCLTWALDTGQRYGVWGGLSEDERRELRRRSPKISTIAPLILI
jgi:WhiB family transcriptional regulator, redox-sensing transcriptional regulator